MFELRPRLGTYFCTDPKEATVRPCLRLWSRILAAVAGGILPPGFGMRTRTRRADASAEPAGHDARLYGRRDARRHANPIPG